MQCILMSYRFWFSTRHFGLKSFISHLIYLFNRFCKWIVPISTLIYLWIPFVFVNGFFVLTTYVSFPGVDRLLVRVQDMCKEANVNPGQQRTATQMTPMSRQRKRRPSTSQGPPENQEPPEKIKPGNRQHFTGHSDLDPIVLWCMNARYTHTVTELH